MQPTPERCPARPPTQMPRARRTGVTTALAAAALLAAGCGNGSPSAGVAHLSSTSTATSGSTTTAASGSDSPAGLGSGNPGAQALKFSECMRSHGVPDFPDPEVSGSGNNVQVRIHIGGPGGGFNPNSSAFKSAQQACRKLLPDGGPRAGSQMSPQEQSQYLKAAACMRSHGVPNLPDPTFSGGGVRERLPSGVNPSSPRFKAAAHVCEALVPGGLHGGGR